MADMSKIQPSSLHHHHHLLEETEDESISPQQTLANPTTNSSNLVIEEEEDYNDDDDDLVNVDARDVVHPYTFNFDSSSFFLPSTSFSHRHHNPEANSKNSCSCCSCESESESELESESDCHDSTVYPDCLFAHEGEEEEYDQMDFITDLFDSRGEIGHVSGSLSRSDVGINDPNDDFVSSNMEELGLGLGFEGAGGGGLRVVGIESDSDTEELGQVNDQNNQRIQIDSNLEHFWDCPASDTAARVDDNDTDRDQLISVIDRIEEISVSSEISSEGDSAVGVLEWEILLAVNNLERDLEFETNGDEGFVYTAEFDTLIGQFVETVRALRGSPPAAKSIIDNLPSVVLKTSSSKDGDHSRDLDRDQDCVICAVCKDEISVEEKVTQLPCRHHYHGDCIVPWLSIRNTCPICRFELPTDDVDYERSKNRVNDDELVVGYGSELSP